MSVKILGNYLSREIAAKKCYRKRRRWRPNNSTVPGVVRFCQPMRPTIKRRIQYQSALCCWPNSSRRPKCSTQLRPRAKCKILNTLESHVRPDQDQRWVTQHIGISQIQPAIEISSFFISWIVKSQSRTICCLLVWLHRHEIDSGWYHRWYRMYRRCPDFGVTLRAIDATIGLDSNRWNGVRLCMACRHVYSHVWAILDSPNMLPPIRPSWFSIRRAGRAPNTVAQMKNRYTRLINWLLNLYCLMVLAVKPHECTQCTCMHSSFRIRKLDTNASRITKIACTNATHRHRLTHSFMHLNRHSVFFFLYPVRHSHSTRTFECKMRFFRHCRHVCVCSRWFRTISKTTYALRQTHATWNHSKCVHWDNVR